MEESMSVKSVLESLCVIGQKQLAKGNLHKSKAAFEYLYRKSKHVNSKVYEEAALINLAATHIEANKPDTAINCLKTAIGLTTPNANYGDIHYNLAIAYEMLDNKKEASKEYDLAIQAYSQMTSVTSDTLVNAAIKAGMLHMKLKHFRRANECFDISTSKLSESPSVIQLASVLCLKAQCLVKSDKTVSEAVQVSEECLNLCKSEDQDLFVVNLCNELGLVFTQSKQYEKSVECFQLALKVIEHLGEGVVPKAKEAAILQNLGAVLNSLGKFKTAIAYSLRAADIYGMTGVRSCQCHCFLNIGFSYSQIKSAQAGDECEQYYHHAWLAAKDTGLVRDQWQACEGLAGISLYKGQIDKAIRFYQSAVGMCAVTGSNASEQERLVRKLSLVLRLKQSANSASSAAGSQVPNLSPAGATTAAAVTTAAGYLSPQYLTPIPSTPTLPFQISNSESSAVILANSAAVRHTVDVSTYAGHTDDTGLYGGKKRKRKRFSRRSDHEGHALHEPVHRGLGTYKSIDGEGDLQNFPGDYIVNKGRRRHYNHDDASSVVVGLKIKGLAVTLEEPEEPRVSGSKGNHFDQLDSSDVVEVRPMSRRLKHRRSKLDVDSELEKVERDFTSEDDDSTKDNSSWSSESNELEAAMNSVAIENRPYGSFVKGEVIESTNSSASESTPKRSDKGKRLMSAKKSCFKVSQRTGDTLLQAADGDQRSDSDLSDWTDDKVIESSPNNQPRKKIVFKEDENLTIYDTGAQNLKEYERKLSRLESSDVSSDESEMNGDSDTYHSEDDNETSEKKLSVDPATGVNFFRTKAVKVVEPTYATIDIATTSAPLQNAPPKLPARNYENQTAASGDNSDEKVESDLEDVSSDGFAEMSRGERDQYLYERQKRQSENVKVVKWKAGKTDNQQKSKACVVM